MKIFFNIINKIKNFTEKEPTMKEILLELIKEKIITWDKKDIYAISLYVEDYLDNPFEPTVTLGYNTEKQVVTALEKSFPKPTDKQEARWNFAFWLQNEEFKFGLGQTQEIVKKWLKKNKFKYYTYQEVFKSDLDIPIGEYEALTPKFVNELVKIVQELHKSGFIKEQFNKEIPIIIHELEYYDVIAIQNIEANGDILPKDFIDFCGYEVK